MSQTTPPTITAAPAPPIRGTSTFKTLVDAFLTWMAAAVAQFQALATNCYNNAVDAFNSAVAAAASAASALGYSNNAAASATAAAVASGVSAWVSGTTYAIGDCRYSPIDFRTYRRKTAGAGTIDPSADATNWAVLSVVPYALTLLATLTPTAAANLDFLNTFNSTYDHYLIAGEGIGNNSGAGTAQLNIRFAAAGAADGGSNYFEMSAGATTSTAVAFARVSIGIYGAGQGINFEIEVFNANDAVQLKSACISAVAQAAATPSYATEVAARVAYKAANAITGFRLYWNAGDLFAATGKIRVYGYQKS